MRAVRMKKKESEDATTAAPSPRRIWMKRWSRAAGMIGIGGCHMVRRAA
jgi:hypothetical protein